MKTEPPPLGRSPLLAAVGVAFAALIVKNSLRGFEHFTEVAVSVASLDPASGGAPSMDTLFLSLKCSICELTLKASDSDKASTLFAESPVMPFCNPKT